MLLQYLLLLVSHLVFGTGPGDTKTMLDHLYKKRNFHITSVNLVGELVGNKVSGMEYEVVPVLWNIMYMFF